jgi:sirohydrochlorin ferrochelatase
MMSMAILLIAHGSRRAEANADLVRIADLLRPRIPQAMIEIAYLELSEPTIPQGLERCVQRNAGEIRMLPYFLSAGAHVSEDLEAFRAEFQKTHPEIRCRLCPPLGLHPGLIDALLDRLNQPDESC